MKQVIKNATTWLARRWGYDIVYHRSRIDKTRADFEDEHIKILRAVDPFTKTTPERVFALIEAVKYIVKNDIPGAMVECGVWKGGSMMAVAHTLKNLRRSDRDLYLFDTYEGMPKPTAEDVDFTGADAAEQWEQNRINDKSSHWMYVPVEEVKQAMYSTGYDQERMHFVKGMVEDTVPAQAPPTIALLRLDTDWYESTRHELVHLFPRLSVGGILIIDDYGHFRGAKKAVDEYIGQNNLRLYLGRIDFSGRVAVKQ
jgi:hypothetical protein